ncbi:MAG: TetR/AcrR family transcriptional regulator [Pseudomonadota bacterium]
MTTATDTKAKRSSSARAPRKPARRRRKDARPSEIITAAKQEFVEKGFADARLEDIAARAGVVKGTIYLYFENKEALFKDVIRSNLLPTVDEYTALVRDFPGPTPDLLKLMVRGMYDKMVRTELRSIIRILLAEGTKFPEILDFYHAEIVTKGEALLRTILERGIARGEFRDAPASHEQRMIVGPVIAAAFWQLTFEAQEPLDLDSYIDAHLDMLMHGLCGANHRPD